MALLFLWIYLAGFTVTGCLFAFAVAMILKRHRLFESYNPIRRQDVFFLILNTTLWFLFWPAVAWKELRRGRRSL